MQPLEQKGANCGVSGLRHTGHFLAWLDMAARDGELGIGAQGDCSAALPREGREPFRLALKHADDTGMGGQRGRAGGLERGAAEEGSCFEGRSLARQLDQRRAAARPDDLDEAEAVDRGPLEGLRQDRVDRLGGALPRFLAGRGRKVDADRALEVEAEDRARRGERAGDRQLFRGPEPSTSIKVIARVGSIASSPPGKRTIPLRASSMRSFHPAAPSRSSGEGKGRSSAPGSGALDAGLSVSLASGRFHGSAPGMASRVTSIRSAPPSAMPGAPRGRRNSLPPARATALRPFAPLETSRASITLPARTTPSINMRASTISPSSIRTMRVSPIPRSASQSGKRIARGLQEVRESRPAAGRRRWNSCPRCGGHRPRHSPAAHSRRPCRAIRRARRRSRFLAAQPLHRDHRLDQPLAQSSAGQAQARPRSARGAGDRTAAPCTPASVASSSTLGRMRRPTATTVSAASTRSSGWPAATAERLFARQPPRMVARTARLSARSRRHRLERSRRERRRCARADRGGAGSPRRGSAASRGLRVIAGRARAAGHEAIGDAALGQVVRASFRPALRRR